MSDYSTQNISKKLINEIEASLKDLDFGSVELFVSNSEVTQIARRHIKKTNNQMGLTMKSK